MGFTVIGETPKVGKTLNVWQTGKFWAKIGMSILLVVIIGISVVFCVSSFYFNELSSEFNYPFQRIGMQVLAALVVTLYSEFVYRFVFGKWAYNAGVDTIFMICIFLVFIILGLITFILFMWFSLVQWWIAGIFSVAFFPLLWAVVLFFVHMICRIEDA